MLDADAGVESAGGAQRAYSLIFPSDLTAKQVIAWLQALSGLPRLAGSGYRSGGLVLELWATDRGIQHRLKAPTGTAEFVVSQLRTLLPGIRVTPTDPDTTAQWSRVVELGAQALTRTFRVPDPSILAANMLTVTQGLKHGETLLIQVVLVPAARQRPPSQPRPPRPIRLGGSFAVQAPAAEKDSITDQRAKLAEVNILMALRIGVRAGTDERAQGLLAGVKRVLASMRSPANGFHARPVPQRVLAERLNAGQTPLLFTAQLTATELTGLLGWPVGSPHVAGMPQARSRHLPLSGAIPSTGLVLARANFPGAGRPLAVPYDDVCKHLHVVGPTGVGKTALLGNLVAQAMRHGNPVIVMERKGDLFKAALDAVPRERLEDVIVMDMTDAHPVGYNLLAEGDPRIAVEEICQLFEYLYPDMRRGIWARAALHRGLSTLITRPGSAFIDLVPLLSPGARSETETHWRDELIAGVTDPELQRFWKRFDDLSLAQQENYAGPILDRAWQLNERPEIKNVIGQSTSSFTMREAIRSRKVLLVNLAGLGVETGRLAGTLLLNAMWSAVRSGACDPARPTFLFLDEFQDFLNLPVDAESMLVQARSFGLAMVLAHQHLDQLPDSIRSAVLANARSKVVFQTTYDDARVFAREFGRTVSDEDFMNLGRYEVLVRLATAEGVSGPVSAETLPLTAPTGLAAEVRASSRERYGRDPADIAADIVRRRTPQKPPPPRKQPRLGGTAWE